MVREVEPLGPVRWGRAPGTVRVLDQTRLPDQEVWVEVSGVDGMVEAIRALRVRGAPLIGVAAALALVSSLERWVDGCARSRTEALAQLAAMAETLRRARPTGRNLGWTMDRLVAYADRSGAADARALVGALRAEADRMVAAEVEQCRRIGEAGLSLLPPRDPVRLLTVCNTGQLATAGIGTALAIVYAAHEAGRDIEVFACETRPLLQGARLTAWELARAGLPVTVLTDSMAAACMALRRPDLVVVGADAIAANGDVANKIGTYGVAVLARHHGLPFYVAAPLSTVDLNLAGGADIPIELRPESEVRGAEPARVPEGAMVWNPAFDVTPASLVTAFVTDRGVLRPPFGPRLVTASQGSAEQ